MIMKTAIKIILITGVFILALIVLTYCPGPGGNENNVKLKPKNVTINKFERKTTHINKDFKPVRGFTHQLIRPIIMKSYRDELFICDYGDMNIIRIDTSGKVKNIIGKGRGKGPGEFTQIMDFSFYDDSIFVLDLNKMMSMEFTLDGEYLRSISLENNTMRLVSYKSGFITLFMGGENLFQHLEKQGNEISRFGNFIENQRQNTLSLGGIIEPINGDGFMYAPMYASIVYYFDYKGNLKSYTKLPAGQSFSSSIKSSDDDNKRIMAPDPTYKTFALNQTPENIYHLVYKQEGDNVPKSEAPEHRALYLNVIDKASREYVKSYQFHEYIEEPVVIDRKIYALKDDTSLVYHNLE